MYAGKQLRKRLFLHDLAYTKTMVKFGNTDIRKLRIHKHQPVSARSELPLPFSLCYVVISNARKTTA